LFFPRPPPHYLCFLSTLLKTSHLEPFLIGLNFGLVSDFLPLLFYLLYFSIPPPPPCFVPALLPTSSPLK
jgi:hypothetical protein